MKVYDPDIRKVLYNSFLSTKEFNKDLETLIIDEFDVCRGVSRVDIAVINDKLHGYEIKSEQDTLERLPMQIESYNKVFDKMTVVVSEKHLKKVNELVPEWWGIYCIISKANNKLVLKKVRKSKVNKNVQLLEVVQLLWKDELIDILNNCGIKKGIKSKTRFALSELVIKNLPKKEIKKIVKLKLRIRTTWRAVELQQICDDLLKC